MTRTASCFVANTLNISLIISHLVKKTLISIKSYVESWTNIPQAITIWCQYAVKHSHAIYMQYNIMTYHILWFTSLVLLESYIIYHLKWSPWYLLLVTCISSHQFIWDSLQIIVNYLSALFIMHGGRQVTVNWCLNGDLFVF